MEGLGINLGYLIIQILGLVVLLLIMKQFAYGPIIRILEERQARIAKGLEDARQAAIARDNADVEAKKIVDAARGEAVTVRTAAAAQAEETAVGITNKANQEAKDILAKAREDAEEERNRILSEMRTQVASISIAAANKLIGEALDEKRQHQLVADFFTKVPASVTELGGESAKVTSALPLSKKEQASIKKSINVKDVEFKVDPSILGGIIVRVGDQVVDDSVANQMSGLRESLLS